MLHGVVGPEGTANGFDIAGFQVAGKTGTTQKIIDGRYVNNRHVASFVGFFPASRPEVVLSVIVDDARVPTGNAYGRAVAAPAFKHVAEQLIPHLERGQRRLIVNITSKMGSIADNSSGGSYAYRTSKAALNMVAKSMAQDLATKRIIVVLFHPGWVRTDMGGPQALLPPKASVAGMRAKIATLTAADSGKFFNYDGKPLPW